MLAPEPAVGLRAPAPAPLALAADSSGGVYAAFLLDGEVVVMRYAAEDGAEVWRAALPEAAAYRGTDGAELVSDDSGVYFGGGGRVGADFPDAEFAYVVRFASTGEEEWRRTFEPTPDRSGVYFSLLVPRPDGIYLVGTNALYALRLDGTEAWGIDRGAYRAAPLPGGGIATYSNTSGRLRGYSGEGDEIWSVTPEAPFALFGPRLSSSETGTLYLGGSAVDQDRQGVGLLAFSQDGASLWSRFYDAADAQASVFALRADAGGVTMAGAVANPAGTLAVRYAADGTWAWADERATPGGRSALTALYGSGSAIGAVGTVSADGPRAARYGYSAGGDLLWSRLDAGAPASLDAAAALHADADGTWLVGRTGDASTTDLAVTRLDDSGAVRWTRVLDGAAFGLPPGSTGEALASALDGAGLLVGGHVAGTPVAARLDLSGAVTWQFAYETGLGDGRGRVVSIAADGSGGAYLGIEAEAEELFANSPNVQVVAVRVDAAGEVQWAVTRGGPYRDRMVEVLAAPYGVAVVTTELPDFLSKSRTVLAAYAPDGSERWTTLYGDEEGSFALLAGIDAQGGVRLLASRNAPSYLVAFDAEGELDWEQFIGQGGELPQGPPVAMTVAEDGTVTALGAAARAFGDPDGYTGPVAYRVAPDGALEWVAPLGHDSPVALSAAPTGEVATVVRDLDAEAFFAATLSADGEVRWTATVPAGEEALPLSTATRPLYRTPLVALAPDFGLYVAQNARASLAISPYAGAWVSEVAEVRYYDGAGLSTDAAPAPPTATFDVQAPYPNPSRGLSIPVRLEVTTPAAGEATVDVFDMLGRMVRTRTHTLGAGTSEIALGDGPLVAGAYVIRVRSPWGTAVHRLTYVE